MAPEDPFFSYFDILALKLIRCVSMLKILRSFFTYAKR